MGGPSSLHQVFALLLIILAVTILIPTGAPLAAAAETPAPTASSLDLAADAETDVEAGNFSIIWITDTQYLAESHPTYFDSLCRWIVNNANTYNVKMVVHTGDLIETEGNVTQWENADRSMRILSDAGIPYCWNAGNHDYNATCWLGNQYAAFNPVLMAQKPYWVADKLDGQNTAMHFNVSGWDCLIVNIAYNASDAVLDWANSLLDAYPESHAIVAAHFYINRAGGYESWATNLKNTVLETHANVFLTLSAHVFPLANSGLRTQVGDRHELVFNRQEKDNYMGAASLRILTFDTTHDLIDIKTYYLYANIFLTDSYNQFTLNTTFRNDLASLVPEFPFSAVILIFIVLSVAVLFVAGWKLRVPTSKKQPAV